MISVSEARKIAENYLGDGYKLKKEVVWDDGEYYIFGYEEVIEEPPVGVDKATGKPIAYTIPLRLKHKNIQKLIIDPTE